MSPILQSWPGPYPRGGQGWCFFCLFVLFCFLRLFGRKNMRGKERQPTQQPSFLLPCTQMPNIAQGSCMTLPRRWILIGLSPASLLPIIGLGMVMWPLPGQWEVSKCLLSCFSGQNFFSLFWIKRTTGKRNPFVLFFFFYCLSDKGTMVLCPEVAILRP